LSGSFSLVRSGVGGDCGIVGGADGGTDVKVLGDVKIFSELDVALDPELELELELEPVLSS
jgi:hypothetical protein